MGCNFKFAVLGDSRGDSHSNEIDKAVLGKIFHDIKKYHDPAFFLFAGDMIYGRNDTASVQRNLIDWREFVARTLGVPTLKDYVYTAIGNHDFSNDIFPQNATAFNNAFSYLPSGPCGEEFLLTYGKTVYYFDYGNSRFIFLNTIFQKAKNPVPGHSQDLIGITEDQQQWLESVLESGHKTNNFVMFHCPIFGTNKGEYYSLPASQQTALFKIFNKYNVAAVYVGHEHQYNRRFINNFFFPTLPDLKGQILQVTSGAAGAPFETLGKLRDNITVGPLAVYNYGIIEVCGGKITSTIYDLNGTCIDSFVYYSVSGPYSE